MSYEEIVQFQCEDCGSYAPCRACGQHFCCDECGACGGGCQCYCYCPTMRD
jgi:hypothetical protein